ncbi:hypothetical protein BDR03DRAFT_968051 [Suillus americanus]|nr:hypothetical protein BDR03DRAFT_968051 [Suillus americanus]
MRRGIILCKCCQGMDDLKGIREPGPVHRNAYGYNISNVIVLTSIISCTAAISLTRTMILLYSPLRCCASKGAPKGCPSFNARE